MTTSLNGDNRFLDNLTLNPKVHRGLPLRLPIMMKYLIDLIVSHPFYHLLRPISLQKAPLPLEPLLLNQLHWETTVILLLLSSEIHLLQYLKILFRPRLVRAVGDRVSIMSRWMGKSSGVLPEHLALQEGKDLVQVDPGGRGNPTLPTALSTKLGDFWSCEYLDYSAGGANGRFPFPIRIDRIKPIMSDHFSKYGSIRAIQPREMTNEAATKAVVVFWVSSQCPSAPQLTCSPSNQSRIVSTTPTGSIVSQGLTQLHPGSTFTSNPSLPRPQRSISR